MTKTTSRSIGFGNLIITQRDRVVELTLNTFIEGRPYALFGYGEIPTLINLLQQYGKPPSTPAAPASVEDDDDDWRDLV